MPARMELCRRKLSPSYPPHARPVDSVGQIGAVDCWRIENNDASLWLGVGGGTYNHATVTYRGPRKISVVGSHEILFAWHLIWPISAGYDRQPFPQCRADQPGFRPHAAGGHEHHSHLRCPPATLTGSGATVEYAGTGWD